VLFSYLEENNLLENQDNRPIAWVIADTETPGLKVEEGICELALREIDPDTLETIDEVQSLIDCQCPIGAVAQEIHGISAEMLVDAPTMQEFIETPGYLDGRFDGRQIVMICHNAPFDVPRLQMIGDITSSICTLFHSRQMWPKSEVGDHKLGTLREHFGFPKNEAHRAMADVATTHRLLREILSNTNRTLRDFHATADTTVHRMPWGQHAGKLMLQLPASYLQWLWGLPDLEKNLRNSVEKVMKTNGVSKKKVAA
jgi:DNA polymerase III epsilon subunit-like protein